ncbi:hypothetical protein XELAEV_18031085mg [Xenopus laevis]|uniref:Uncharacterized protein n=1 Tax=Xenopus laevis TaxID=8355 RepID=A0A974CLY3_XENLA|nr:hypothetical protein XELAEV_18031085mg [Xenopus laevis]
MRLVYLLSTPSRTCLCCSRLPPLLAGTAAPPSSFPAANATAWACCSTLFPQDPAGSPPPLPAPTDKPRPTEEGEDPADVALLLLRLLLLLLPPPPLCCCCVAFSIAPVLPLLVDKGRLGALNCKAETSCRIKSWARPL